MSIAPFFATKTVLKFVSPIVSPGRKKMGRVVITGEEGNN